MRCMFLVIDNLLVMIRVWTLYNSQIEKVGLWRVEGTVRPLFDCWPMEIGSDALKTWKYVYGTSIKMTSLNLLIDWLGLLCISFLVVFRRQLNPHDSTTSLRWHFLLATHTYFGEFSAFFLFLDVWIDSFIESGGSSGLVHKYDLTTLESASPEPTNAMLNQTYSHHDVSDLINLNQWALTHLVG